MISFLFRMGLLMVVLNLLACSNAPSEPQESEPVDSTTHFNDSTEAV